VYKVVELSSIHNFIFIGHIGINHHNFILFNPILIKDINLFIDVSFIKHLINSIIPFCVKSFGSQSLNATKMWIILFLVGTKYIFLFYHPHFDIKNNKIKILFTDFYWLISLKILNFYKFNISFPTQWGLSLKLILQIRIVRAYDSNSSL